ncbi:MAG: bifunctional oligoribonuclease/PAP phosphatase NrnA [Firmicutes bacterium]|nr:bifunctional oligoribonuclease/PAP phosphatase NrnA [Bacillota bacterium]
MKKNNTFQEIAKQLLAAKSVLIYPHVNMDGDAMGSGTAMCRALRSLGKESYVLIEDDIARNLQFLDEGYCTRNQDVMENPEVSLCLDCGDMSRFPKRKDKFLEGKVTICIDHHRTSQPFCDFNYIDPGVAATGELIYQLLLAMDAPKDRQTANALFAAISTDTGNFQHSNTTKQSHMIVADLYDWGVEANMVSREIYNRVRLERIRIQNRALQNMEIFAGGQAAMAYVDGRMLLETGAGMDETEGTVDQLKSIDGVEIAVFVKSDWPMDRSEEPSAPWLALPEKVKISMRAKSWSNVAAIAEKLGGGGHIKAAGCTLNMPLKDALPLIKKEVEDALL